MGNSANVTSVDALITFRAAWIELQEKILQAISTTEGEITAAFRYLEQQQQYWKIEVTKRHEFYVQAKLILNRKELGRTFGHKVDTTVAEEDVRKAKARWQSAEQRAEHVRKWKPRLEYAVREYLGPRQGLSVQAETEMVKALAFLDQKIDALEKYLALSAPVILASGAEARP
jgi:BMFP domain-containing protein YqiC